MTFNPGRSGNPAGRPRGRIAAFREMVGELTGDGREIAEGLRAIYKDPVSTPKERLDAYALLLSYLLGKPEAAVSIDANVRAMVGPPAGWEMMGPGERAAHLDALQAGARSAPQLALAAAALLDDDEEHG